MADSTRLHTDCTHNEQYYYTFYRSLLQNAGVFNTRRNPHHASPLPPRPSTSAMGADPWLYDTAHVPNGGARVPFGSSHAFAVWPQSSSSYRVPYASGHGSHRNACEVTWPPAVSWSGGDLPRTIPAHVGTSSSMYRPLPRPPPLSMPMREWHAPRHCRPTKPARCAQHEEASEAVSMSAQADPASAVSEPNAAGPPERFTPLNITTLSETYCLLCGVHGHAYTACDVYCGNIVCLYSQRHERVYCMNHEDWFHGATVRDVVCFVCRIMRLSSCEFDVYLNGHSLAEAMVGHGRHNAEAPRTDVPSMSLLTEAQSKTPCYALGIVPGCVLYVTDLTRQTDSEPDKKPSGGEANEPADEATEQSGGAEGTPPDDGTQEERVMPTPVAAAYPHQCVSFSQPSSSLVSRTEPESPTTRARDADASTRPPTPTPEQPMATTATSHSSVNRTSDCTIFIRNVTSTLREREIRCLLDAYGTVRRVRLCKGPPRFAPDVMYCVIFVEYTEWQAAAKARLALDKRVMGGQAISVQMARRGIQGTSWRDRDALPGQPCLFGRGRPRTLHDSERDDEENDAHEGGDEKSGDVEQRPFDDVIRARDSQLPEQAFLPMGEAVVSAFASFPSLARHAFSEPELAPRHALCVLAYVYVHSRQTQEADNRFFAVWNLAESMLHSPPGWVRTMTARAALAMLNDVVRPSADHNCDGGDGGLCTARRALMSSLSVAPAHPTHPVLLALELLVLEAALFVHRRASDPFHCAFMASDAVTEVCTIVACFEGCIAHMCRYRDDADARPLPTGDACPEGGECAAQTARPPPTPAIFSALGNESWRACFTPTPPAQQASRVHFSACVRTCTVTLMSAPPRAAQHGPQTNRGSEGARREEDDAAALGVLYARVDVLNCFLLRLAQLFVLMSFAAGEEDVDDVAARPDEDADAEAARVSEKTEGKEADACGLHTTESTASSPAEIVSSTFALAQVLVSTQALSLLRAWYTLATDDEGDSTRRYDQSGATDPDVVKRWWWQCCEEVISDLAPQASCQAAPPSARACAATLLLSYQQPRTLPPFRE